MFSYLFSSTISLSLSWILYKLVLKREKTFVFNRFYLLSTLVLGLVIPSLEIENRQFSEFITNDTTAYIIESVEPEITTETTINYETLVPTKTSFNWMNLFYCLYSIGFMFLFCRFLLNLKTIRKLITGSAINHHVSGMKVIPHENSTFSFFNYLFINKTHAQIENIPQEVLLHERIHAKQWHSIDILISELCIILFWFNPIVSFYRKEISENHEYLADHGVLQSGIESDSYANQLLSYTQQKTTPLSCGFSFIQTKNRILMLQQQKASLLRISFKLSLAIIISGLSLSISSFSYKKVQTPLTIVLDPGHGGKDPGASMGGILEKDITLAIAKQLQAIDHEGEFNFIFSRSSDQFVSLKERVNTINEVAADFFIGFHTMESENPSLNHSVSIYFPAYSDTNKMELLSKLREIEIVVKSMSNNINQHDKPSAFQVGSTSSNSYVLKQLTHPGFNMQLTFAKGITQNPQDNEYFINDLAQKIYISLLEWKSTRESNK